MMLVRTIRKHQNAFGDSFVKHPRKQYEVTEAEGNRLIGLGYVEAVTEKADEGQD